MEEERKPITINISYHFMVRIAERVHKITHLNEQQMRDHVQNNKLSLMERALYMFEISDFLWQGSLSEKFSAVNFFICEHGVNNCRYVIITDSSQTNLITLYPIEFANFPIFMAKSFENKLVNRALRLREQQQRVAKRKKPMFQDRRQRISNANDRIRRLEEKIEYQRSKIISHQADIKAGEDAVEKIWVERGEIAKLLCYSKYVTSDLSGWKQEKV